MSSSRPDGKLAAVGSLEHVHDWDMLAREALYRPRKLAGVCQISLRTLERHFQRHYGLKVGRWLKEVRLTDAYREIQKGASIKVVALDLGYKQLSHFSRDFKQKFGVSPSLLSPSSRRKPGLRLESPTSPQIVFTF